MLKILIVFGTRPEAIKLCPVVRYMKCFTAWRVFTCVTAQHRHLLDQVLKVFEVEPDYDLNCMTPGQTLTELTSRMIAALGPVIRAVKPDIVLVQGDTTTTLCGALAAFYERIPVGHVEAGLRTGNMYQPFPEEVNRVLVARLATLHFAATEWAANNLYLEGVDKNVVVVTGNTGIDSVFYCRDRLEKGLRPEHVLTDLWNDARKLILVTAHRRESFGEGFEQICAALAALADRPDVRIVFPVHPNPNVTGPVRRHLSGRDNVHLLDPLDYVSFVDLLRHAAIVLTDSGGIQEEAPSLGKPVLVMRHVTERPEAVRAGTARLVGNEKETILRECCQLLDDNETYNSMARSHNPYGDGHASERIAMRVRRFFGETHAA